MDISQESIFKLMTEKQTPETIEAIYMSLHEWNILDGLIGWFSCLDSLLILYIHVSLKLSIIILWNHEKH